MAEDQPQKSAIEHVARGVAGLFLEAGTAIQNPYPELKLAQLPQLQQGMLISAISIRRLLCSTAEGRQALRDLGFQPLLDDVQGE